MSGSMRRGEAPTGRLPNILDRIADELLKPEERLYLDRSGHAVMMWRRDEASLKRGEYPFVVGVDLTDQRSIAISVRHLATLTAYVDGTSATRLEEALSELQRFRIERHRYHGTLDALKPEECVYVDTSGHTIMMWRRDEAPLRRGEYPFVVGADLTDRRPIVISARYLSTLTADFDGAGSARLGEVLSELQRFRTEGHRYHGVLDAQLSHGSGVLFTARGPEPARIRWTDLSDLSIIGPGSNEPAKRLDEVDVRLINTWSHYPPDRQLSVSDLSLQKSDRFRLNRRFIYARMAEKFVHAFYTEQLRKQAVDVSARQLDENDLRWITHDIAADVPIDVKNATVFGSRRRHNFVEQFKRTGGREVYIAGVLTEYPAPSLMGVRQAFLGLVSLPDVERALSAVNELPGRAGPVRLSFDSGYIPPWAFEVDAYRQQYGMGAEWIDILAANPETRIAVSIAGGRHRDSSIYRGMNVVQKAFVDRLVHVIDRASYRKLSIALFAISEFLAALARGNDASNVIRFIRRLISVSAEGFSGTAIRIAGLGSGLIAAKSMRETYKVRLGLTPSAIGGLHDPTKSLVELLDLLEKAGDRIARSELKLAHFDAPSPYILLARTISGRKVTVYAYCGGKKDNGYPCERFPLVMGRHATCDDCGRLICDDCDFCSAGCDRGERQGRQMPWHMNI
ncbi:MAG: hypothetical protein Q7T08_06365 [Devosia sp.]|nr:hypothetical protein [Devosia sp.]